MVNLSKSQKVVVDLEKKGSRLVNLAKSASVVLTKTNLDGTVSRVVVVIDGSGSMTGRFQGGVLQAALDRVAVLALNLDDNGELDAYGYATEYRKLESITVNTLDGYVGRLKTNPTPSTGDGGFWSKLLGSGGAPSEDGYNIYGLGWSNNEPPVMQAIIDEYKGDVTVPTLVIFITDGGIDKGALIKQRLITSSSYPIFWQFVGLGGSDYGILESFDTMTGRKIDNAGFFAIDDFRAIKDEELFRRLVTEYPSFLSKAKAQGILRAA